MHGGAPRQGRAELQTPGLCAGTRDARYSGQKQELGPPRPCSWLHLRTHLIPGVGQTGQPQLGDELGRGVELCGTGEAAVLPRLSSAPPMLMVIFFSLSHLLFLLIVI